MAPNGKRSTTVVPIIIPWACSYLITVCGLGPITTADPEPEPEPEDEPEPDVEEGEEPEAVFVEEADERKGLEFEDMEAAERSNSNWRVLSGECCASV
jgi:hypothetical protein